MRIIAYTYDAGEHCIECTIERAALGNGLRLDRAHSIDFEPCFDENGVAYRLIDDEGNQMSAIFSTDEVPQEGLYCADCYALIKPCSWVLYCPSE